MRTTLRFDDYLLRQAKAEAAHCGRSLTAFVEETLRARLLPQLVKIKKKKIKLPTYNLGGTRPGVDLNNNRAVRDLIDDDGKFTQC